MWNILQSFFLYFIVFLSSVVLLIILYYQYAFKHWNKLGIPHPKPSFPLGNMDPKFSKQLGQTLSKIYFEMKKKGHAYCGYHMFAMPVFMPINPEIVKQLLTVSFSSFGDRGFHLDEKNDPMGSSLLTWSGEKWAKMRQKLSPTFSPGKTKMMLPIVMKCTEDLESVIDEKVKKGEPINIQDIAIRYTVDVICSCAFGVEGNCLNDPSAEFIRHAKMIFTTHIVDNMRIAIGMAAPAISKAFKMHLFSPTATGFFRNVVRETVAYREANNVQREDFLNLMIRMKNHKSIEDGEEKSNKITKDDETYTIDQIAAQCFLFFIAGFETTSSTVQFVMYELARNPDIQQKTREDVLEVLKNNDNKLTYETIRDMRYLENVISEALRKYPVAHMLNRLCTKDFKIPGTDITIKKGTRAVVTLLGLHMDPEFFPDPEKFNPDRFTDEAKAARQPFVYLPFGDGPRICPGMRFGMMEVKLCIAFLLLKFKFASTQTIKLCSLGNVLGTEAPIMLTAERYDYNN